MWYLPNRCGFYLRALLLFSGSIGVGFCMPFVASAPEASSQSNQVTIRLARNADPAPDINLSGLDGKPVTLRDLRGKVILLNFWATWCGPCRAEIPDLIALQSRYKDQLQIIGLVVDADDPDEIKKLIQISGINYPNAIATTDIRIRYGNVTALPTSFLLDSEGRIVQKHIGLRNPVLYELEIRALLGLPIPAKVETFEDTGEIFLKNADRATSLPGVDLSQLFPEQRLAALHTLNATGCSCGCKLTLAQCRINDAACKISLEAANKIVADLLVPQRLQLHPPPM